VKVHHIGLPKHEEKNAQIMRAYSICFPLWDRQASNSFDQYVMVPDCAPARQFKKGTTVF